MSDLTIRAWFKNAVSNLTDNTIAFVRMTIQQALHVNLRDNSGAELGTVGNPLVTTGGGGGGGVVTQGTVPWVVDGSGFTQPVSGTVTANQGTAGATAWKTDGSGVTQPISGSVTVLQGTAANLNATVAGTVTVQQSTGTNLHTVLDSGTLTSVTNPVTVQQATAANLKVDLSGTGANSTALKVDGSAVTQPVSGTVTATQGTGTNLHTVVDSGAITVSQGTGTNLHTVVDSGSITATVSGTVTANQGSPPWTVDGPNAAGSTSIAAPVVVGGSDYAGTPHTQTAKVDSSGLLHTNVDNTVGVSGTITANQGGAPWTVKPDGTVWTLTGTSANVNLTNASVTVAQGTGTNLHTVLDSGTLTSITNAVTVSQGTGTNLHAVLDSGTLTSITNAVTVSQGTGTNLHTVVDSGSITVTQGTGTNLHTVVDSGSITASVSGTVTANQGAPPWTVKPDGTSWTETGTSADVNLTNASVTVAQGTGTNLHTVLDSGTLTSITNAVTVSQGTGTNLHTVVDSGSVTATVSGTVTAVGASTPADSTTTPTTAQLHEAFGMVFNGLSWDQMRGDKANGLQVNVSDMWTLIQLMRQMLIEMRGLRMAFSAVSGQYIDDDDLEPVLQ